MKIALLPRMVEWKNSQLLCQ